MKATDKDRPVYTTPKGAWEGGIINERKERSKHKDSKISNNTNDITTDLQGNGYPVSSQKRNGH